MDLDLVQSSAASVIVGLVMGGLRQDGDLETDISPKFLIRNWPPAFKELVTKSVRDAFYAAPDGHLGRKQKRQRNSFRCRHLPVDVYDVGDGVAEGSTVGLGVAELDGVGVGETSVPGLGMGTAE